MDCKMYKYTKGKCGSKCPKCPYTYAVREIKKQTNYSDKMLEKCELIFARYEKLLMDLESLGENANETNM